MNTSIEFLHPENYKSEKKYNFGIFKLKLKKLECRFEKLHWKFNIDRSGSMYDVCADNKTKMDHIKHTLCNIIKFSKI